MPLHVAFTQTDITPPLGTHKVGWLKDIVSTAVLDPLFARIAVFESGDDRIAFIQLDTLSVRAEDVQDIRGRLAARCGFPGECVMVSATHNHAGPAVISAGEVRRDAAYVESMIGKVVAAFGQAAENMQPAEIGFGVVFEFGVGYNRRVIMRDGTVRTHGAFNDPNALCLEGPVDPEVAVLAARAASGEMLGALVNYACHPTHYGGDTLLSAGYPGVLARTMKERGCPVTLFLNGACGNISHSDPCEGGAGKGMEEAGLALADDVSRAMEGMTFRSDAKLGWAHKVVELPFRTVTEEEIRGAARGAQRFIDPAIYDREIPRLLETIEREKVQLAEVQVLSIGEHAFAAIPAEYFVQHGLRIKEQTHPRHALVVSCANGMVGYVPHTEAFARGGYETTFLQSSKLAPEAGDILAEAAIELIRQAVP